MQTFHCEQMALQDELEQQGNWLFRWRSYLPLSMILLIALALHNFASPRRDYQQRGSWDLVCIGVSLFGLALRGFTVGCVPAGTSGRTTRRQIAEALNTTGAYSVVRHPLYVGNYIVGLGVTLTVLDWWLPFIYTLLFWLYYERIMLAEEQFLRSRFGIAFDEWAAVTPAFIPRPSQWRSADLRFSVRNVLKREYTALLLIALTHGSIEIAESYLTADRPVIQLSWVAFILSAVGIYITLRALKKRTTLLNVPGR